MTAPQKLMARLNAPNIRLDIGSGGKPELTPQDIAGALAFIPDPLAREVFCLLWWPDGSQVARHRVLGALRTLSWEEQTRRTQAQQQAAAAAALAREELRSARAGDDTAELHRALAIAESKAHAARHVMWPRKVEVYTLLVLAVIQEVGATRNCPKCQGRETVASPFGPKNCDRCGAAGKVAYTTAARAQALKIDESTFRRLWIGPYDWLYAKVNDYEQAAIRAFRDALK